MDCQEWRIADINQKGSANTVDLFSRYTLTNDRIRFDTVSPGSYENSYLRTWLNSTIYNGFSDNIKNAIADSPIRSRGASGVMINEQRCEIIYDKVKAPSLQEVGCGADANAFDWSYYGTGIIYPIFGSSQKGGGNSLAAYTSPKGAAMGYWTRDCRNYNGAYNAAIVTSSFANQRWMDSGDYYHADASAVGVIRFCKK